MSAALKALLLSSLRIPGVSAPFAPFMSGCAAVLMLHRFHDGSRGVAGHDPAALRRALSYLRRHRYELLRVDELLARLRGEGPPVRRAVCFTIDDGYEEQATVAAPVFAAFDCPVTTFVTSGFLDRAVWFWWDRIEYCTRRSPRASVRLPVGGRELVFTLDSPGEREEACRQLTALCKRLPEAAKLATIERLAVAAGVELPAAAPPEYAPMSWDQLRAAERLGMSFGPHTVTHPILSRTEDPQAWTELSESWRRLRAESAGPVPVFAYPNGGPDDFGAREVRMLRALGLVGAVTGIPEVASADMIGRDGDAPYLLPRFAYPDRLPHLIQYVSGLERAKQVVRAAGLA